MSLQGHERIRQKLPDLVIEHRPRPLLWLHALGCRSCRNLLRRLRSVDRALRELARLERL